MIQKLHIEKFRGFQNVDCTLGSQITAIAGQNGTQKTVLLGILSQPFSITDGENPMKGETPLCGGNYKSAFADKFKFSPEFDIPKGHEWTLYVDGNDPFTLESIPRSGSGNVRFYRKGDHRKGAGYLQYPVIYLSLKRLFPIGEDNNIKESDKVQLTPEEIQEFKTLHKKILISQDKVDTPQYIESSNKNTLGVNTDLYDWRLNSAGQDNLGKIVLALLSFKRLHTKYGADYKGGILAIDELDSALYPASQMKLFEELRHYAAKYNIQVIFTTHSLSLLEEACKQYEESQKHGNAKGTIQVLYLEKEDGQVKLTNIKSYQTIKNRLNVSTGINPPKKLTVYTEDEEGAIFAKNLMPYKWRSKFSFETCTMGCDAYLTLIDKKIPAFQLPQACIILDGDADAKVKKIRWGKLVTAKNVICLPGSTSPERELAAFLADSDAIKDAHPFWKSLNSDYSRQVCFRDQTIEEIQADRNKAKAWFKGQTPIWGKQSNKAIALWAESHQEEIAGFQEELKEAYNVFARAFELEEID